MTDGLTVLTRFQRGLMSGVAGMAIGLAGMVSASAADLPKDLHFQVFMGEKDIGTHVIEFSEGDAEGTVNVDIDIDLAVKYAFITFFKYSHDNSEVWAGNELLSLTSNTEDDGRDFFVEASRASDLLQVNGSRGAYETAQVLSSTSYWNLDALLGAETLVNSQKGDLLDFTLEKLGSEEVTARGETVMADKYFLDAKIDTTLWYSQETKEWVKMTFEARDRTFRYELIDPAAKVAAGEES